MERYARFIVAHARSVVATILVITAFAVSCVPNLRLEIRRRAQLPESHPYVQVQNRIADLFGGETTVIVGIMPRQGDIFRTDILEKIQRITRKLSKQAGVVPSTLLSIAAEHVRAIRPTDGGIELHPFLEEVPKTQSAIDALRVELLRDPIFSGTLVARDGKAAAIVVDFDDQLTDVKIYAAVESIIDGERNEQVDIAVGGAPLVRAYMADYIRQMGYLFLGAVIVIGLVHYEAFRTLQAMLLPLATAVISVLWAMGILASWGQPLDTWSALTPIVVLAVAAGHAVQILKRYYEEYRSAPSNSEAIVRSLIAVGPVMIVAGTIAAAGFASLMTFGVASVRVFGLTLALGILSSLVIEMTFIPAVRTLLPPPRDRDGVRESGRLFHGLIEWLAQYTTRRPGLVLTAAAIVVGISLIGALQVRVDNSFHSWFPEQSRLRVDDRLLNEKLAGTSTLYVLIEGENEGDLLDPPVLRALGDLEKWLKNQPNIGAAFSVYDYVKHMHEVMTGESAIPADRALIEQYLFLYSMSGPDQLSSVIDSAHQNGVLRAYVKTDEAEYGRRLLGALQQFATSRFDGLPVRPRVAGGAVGVQTALNEVVVKQKLMSILQVAAIIFMLSALALRSPVGGLLVITPLLIAVSISLGVMGFTGTWLSVGTATVNAMAASIGADFAIYLLYRIREEIRAGLDVAEALGQSLRTAGSAICFVAAAVVLGYLVLSLSGFRLWIHLGVLTALMIIVSALAALTIVPSIVMIARPRFLLTQRGVGEASYEELGAPIVR